MGLDNLNAFSPHLLLSDVDIRRYYFCWFLRTSALHFFLVLYTDYIISWLNSFYPMGDCICLCIKSLCPKEHGRVGMCIVSVCVSGMVWVSISLIKKKTQKDKVCAHVCVCLVNCVCECMCGCVHCLLCLCVCVVLIANGDCQVGYRETVMTA